MAAPILVDLECGRGVHHLVLVQVRPLEVDPSDSGDSHAFKHSLEVEVLSLAAIGAGDRAIAQELKLDLYTVKRIMRTMLVKLAARNRTEACFVALANGLVDLNQLMERRANLLLH